MSWSKYFITPLRSLALALLRDGNCAVLEIPLAVLPENSISTPLPQSLIFAVTFASVKVTGGVHLLNYIKQFASYVKK